MKIPTNTLSHVQAFASPIAPIPSEDTRMIDPGLVLPLMTPPLVTSASKVLDATNVTPGKANQGIIAKVMGLLQALLIAFEGEQSFKLESSRPNVNVLKPIRLRMQEIGNKVLTSFAKADKKLRKELREIERHKDEKVAQHKAQERKKAFKEYSKTTSHLWNEKVAFILNRKAAVAA